MNGKLKKKDKKEHGVQGLSGAVLEVIQAFRLFGSRNSEYPLRVFFWDGSQYGVPFGDGFRRRHFCYELLKRLYQQIQKSDELWLVGIRKLWSYSLRSKRFLARFV